MQEKHPPILADVFSFEKPLQARLNKASKN